MNMILLTRVRQRLIHNEKEVMVIPLTEEETIGYFPDDLHAYDMIVQLSHDVNNIQKITEGVGIHGSWKAYAVPSIPQDEVWIYTITKIGSYNAKGDETE